VIGGLRALAGLAAGLVAAAWIVWLVDAPPRDASEWAARVVVLAVLLVPSAVLVLFVSGLRELGRLSERARALPADVRTRTRQVRAPRGVRGLLASLFRLARLAWGSREVLSPYAAIAMVLRPAILLATLGATAAAIIEVPASVLAMLLMALA
jgi:hypothetical protein